MEDGSKIIVFIICLNLVALSVSGLNYYGTGYQYLINDDYISEFLILDPASRLFGFGGASFVITDEFTNVTGQALEPQSSGVNVVDSVVGVFLDGLKMALGVLAFLTPLPIISFAVGLNLPIILMLFIFVPLVIRYLIAIAEIIRSGGKL
jgi:hypothetical protein